MRITAILASGAALVFPWIVSQSIADFSRTLFGRSDLELILASPVDAHALLAARALSISVGAVASVGLLLGAARRRRRSQGPSALAGALSGPDRGGARGDGLCDHSVDGPVSGDRPATRAPLRPDRSDSDRRVRRAWGAGCRHAARGDANDDPRGPRAACKCGDGAAQGLLWAPVRAAAGDPQAILVWTAFGAVVFALACVLFGERFARAAIASAGAPAHAGVGARGTARFGASASTALRIKERRVVWRDPWLMSQLLLQAAYTTPLAVILWRGGGADGHGRRRLHAGARGDRRATRRARSPGSRSRPRTRRIFSRPLPCRAPSSNAPRSPPSASRSRSFSPCPSPHWPSHRPGLGFARSCSAPARSPRPRWSISGDRRHRVAASCCVVIPSRSSSA